MSSGLPSDEVAEDYKSSLEDLTINSRYEISNLTVIAKENTEHAMAISRVIENHIRTTPPDRKLPALYVLDSVVKNVGTPYTLFLGRSLYKTFMEAYAAVGSTPVRKKLDEMLKTWKEPVPGSMDTRPVFPAEVTRPIENDLIRWRTLDLQKQQEQARNQQNMARPVRPSATPWRNTPTPPQHMSRYQQPVMQGYPVQPNGVVQQTRSPYSTYPHPPPQPTPPVYHQPYEQMETQQHPHRSQYTQHSQLPANLDSLHKDIENLIATAKSEFLKDVNNSVLRDKLKALLDLQSILAAHQLAPHELEAVRQKVAELSAPSVSAPYPPPVNVTHAPYSSTTNTAQHAAPQDHTQISAPSVPSHLAAPPFIQQQNQPDLSMLNSNRLADILASAKALQAPPTPPVASTPIPYSQPPNDPMPAAGSGGEPSALLARLRAAGILAPERNTSVNGSLVPPSQYPPPQAPGQLPTTPLAALASPSQLAAQNDVELTTASLKKPRPHLISSLYEAFPSQCSTCGKRFLATAEGRKRKEKHLDWHFRIRIKREDAARRGQSRSWYVSELEWIKWRETNEDGEDELPNGAKAPQAMAAAAAAAAQDDPKKQYILVPDDHTLANLPCPICHEPFEKSYDDTISDWVWKDAVKVGSRVYHASEYADMKKDGGSTPLRTATPDSVLGKRKAAVGFVRISPLKFENSTDLFVQGDDVNATRLKVSKDIISV